MQKIMQGLTAQLGKLRASLADLWDALRRHGWRGSLGALFDLAMAALLCLLVAALAGIIVVVIAWLYGAPGSGLRAWFIAGFLLGLLAIALLFLWDRRA